MGGQGGRGEGGEGGEDDPRGETDDHDGDVRVERARVAVAETCVSGGGGEFVMD